MLKTLATEGLFFICEIPNRKSANAARNIRNPKICLDLRQVLFALMKSRLDDSVPDSQSTNAGATGKAACWQGYAARLGLGITRTRNQISAARPARGKTSDFSLPVLRAWIAEEFSGFFMKDGF